MFNRPRKRIIKDQNGRRIYETSKEIGDVLKNSNSSVIDNIKNKEFQETTKKTMTNFVQNVLKTTKGNQEQAIIGALTNLLTSVYNHSKKDRKLIFKKTLDYFLENIEKIELSEGLHTMYKETDKDKLPELAKNLFLEIIQDEIKEGSYSIKDVNGLEILAKMIETL